MVQMDQPLLEAHDNPVSLPSCRLSLCVCWLRAVREITEWILRFRSEPADDTELRALFDKLDADGGGTLDASEIGTLLGSLGKSLGKAQMDALMKRIDGDGSGSVEYAEFSYWWWEEKEKTLETTSGLVRAESSSSLAAQVPGPPLQHWSFTLGLQRQLRGQGTT